MRQNPAKTGQRRTIATGQARRISISVKNLVAKFAESLCHTLPCPGQISPPADGHQVSAISGRPKHLIKSGPREPCGLKQNFPDCADRAVARAPDFLQTGAPAIRVIANSKAPIPRSGQASRAAHSGVWASSGNTGNGKRWRHKRI